MSPCERQPLVEAKLEIDSHLTEEEVSMAAARTPRKPDMIEQLRIDAHTFLCRECWRRAHPALREPETDKERAICATADAVVDAWFPTEHPALDDLYAFQDGRLEDPALLAEVRHHLESCVPCSVLLLEREELLPEPGTGPGKRPVYI